MKLSTRYIAKIKRLLKSYKNGDYLITDKGSCNICLGRNKGENLVFFYETPDSETFEFAHKECLESLLDEDCLRAFIEDKTRKIRDINLRLIAKYN